MLLLTTLTALAASPFGVPDAWLQAMRNAGVLVPERQTIHVSHTCDLVVESRTIHVVDARQVLAHMAAPRGFNFIVLLDADRVVSSLRYVDQRPLRCDGGRLLLHGALALDGAEGNQLEFTDGGARVRVHSVRLTDVM